MNKNEIDLSWAAGLFEGEGTFTLSRWHGNSIGPKAALVMGDEEIVNRFHRIVGLGRVCIENRKQRASHHKVMYRWTVSERSEFLDFASLLMPYLGARRREQLIVVLDSITAFHARTRALEDQRLALLSQLTITS